MYALIILSSLGILALCAGIFQLRKLVLPIVVLGLLTAIVMSANEWGVSTSYFDSMMRTDNYALSFIWIILGISLLWFMFISSSIITSSHYEDYFALVLFSLVGAVVMVSFSNLVMLFLGIEILSISMYILAGSNKDKLDSNEASLKYFLLGAFSTGFLLFGIALIYGVSGSFNIDVIRAGITPDRHSALMLTGVLLVLVSLSFKIAAFPFHFWAPDVYEGSPVIITTFMATVVKVAAIAAFYRLFSHCFTLNINDWHNSIWILSVSSILIGNIVAVFQTNVKRMLAYSGIAHAGYMLMALISVGEYSQSALIIYALSYAIATFTAFSVLIQITESTGSADMNSFNHLGKRNRFAAISMSLAMLSLAGIPPTAGFFGKYFLFTASLQSGNLPLVLVAVTGTLISIYYYFRVILAMFVSTGSEEKINIPLLRNIVLGICALLIIILGIFPEAVLHWIGK